MLEEIKFSVFGIAEIEPLIRLKHLLLTGSESVREVEEFTQRFGISELNYLKSLWEASQQGFNDILNHLLNIKDFQFIKTQLAIKLKQTEHSFKDLIKIEERQLFIVTTNLREEPSTKNVKRVLKSIMFSKKLRYKNEF